jgi:hypothetical protein
MLYAEYFSTKAHIAESGAWARANQSHVTLYRLSQQVHAQATSTLE